MVPSYDEAPLMAVTTGTLLSGIVFMPPEMGVGRLISVFVERLLLSLAVIAGSVVAVWLLATKAGPVLNVLSLGTEARELLNDAACSEAELRKVISLLA
jgi:uncharacterized membrane protein YccC